jgi:hypothetical protein
MDYIWSSETCMILWRKTPRTFGTEGWPSGIVGVRGEGGCDLGDLYLICEQVQSLTRESQILQGQVKQKLREWEKQCAIVATSIFFKSNTKSSDETYMPIDTIYIIVLMHLYIYIF